jgi:hypothetical protein
MTDSNGLSRRRFLSAVVSTAATSCLPLTGAAILAGESIPAEVQYSHVSLSAELPEAPVSVTNSGYLLLIDSKSGSISSLQSTFGIDRELLIPNHEHLPLFKIELMDGYSEFKTVSASQAREIHVQKSGDANEQTLAIEFKEIGGLSVNARVTVRCPRNETLTYWNLELDNGTKSWIAHVQFPVIQVPFDDAASGRSSHILSSFADGMLAGPVEPSMAGARGEEGSAIRRRSGVTTTIPGNGLRPSCWLITMMLVDCMSRAMMRQDCPSLLIH